MYPVLSIDLSMLKLGLNFGNLPFWNPQDVNFQAPALVSSHTHRRSKNHGHLPNLPD